MEIKYIVGYNLLLHIIFIKIVHVLHILTNRTNKFLLAPITNVTSNIDGGFFVSGIVSCG